MSNSSNISFNAKPELAERLENRADELSLTKSEIIRRAIVNHLEG